MTAGVQQYNNLADRSVSWEFWPLIVSCFQADCVIPQTVPLTILIKDDWSWGPGFTGAE